MAEERVYQGQTYRRNNPNEPWVRVGGQGGFIAGPNAGAREARAQQDQQFEAQRLQLEQQRVALAQQQAALAAQQTQASIPKMQADAERARAEADAAIKEQANAPDPSMARVRKELQTDNVLANINAARSQIGNGWATGNVAGTRTFQGLPFIGQNSTNLDASLAGIKGAVINDTLAALKAESASGASGYGSLTEREADRLASAVAALQQTQSEEDLLRNLARVERHYRNSIALLNGEDPRAPEVAEKYGIVSGDGEESTGGGSGGSLTSEGRWEGDPALRGVNASVRDMIRRGRSVEDIRSYLDTVQPGLGARVQDLDRAVAAVRQNPGQEFNVDIEKQWIPSSGMTRALGEVGMSAPGAALIGAADTASLGFLDNLTGNPELTRAVMTGVQEENPTSYLLGQIGGGVTTGLGIEGLMTRGGLTGLRGMRAGDAAFGAGYGAGMADDPEDSRVMSALGGATAGVAGGMAGRALGRGVGRGIAGVQDAAQRRLYNADVPMTPGQILGGTAKSVEDRLSGFPIVGDAINARRGEGIEGFNRAATDPVAEALGAPSPQQLGAPAIDALRTARSNRYSDLLDNRQFGVDEALESDVATLLARAEGLPPELQGQVTTSLQGRIGNAVEDIGGTDVISGRSYQRALRGLDRDVRSLNQQAPVLGDVAEDVVRGGRQALLDVVERQDPGIAEELARINAANMEYETLRAAVNAARNQGGEQFMPSQLSTAAAQQARRFGNNQGTTNQPFYELTRAGQEVLPSKIPDSGTAGRLALPFIAGGLAGGGSAAVADEGERTGSGLTGAAIGAAVAAAPYSRTARDIIMEALLRERPEVVRAAGERIYNNADIARLLTAPAAAGYATQ